jgi:hypothetical protein
VREILAKMNSSEHGSYLDEVGMKYARDATDVTDTSSDGPEDERLAKMTAAFKNILEVCTGILVNG